MIVLLDHQLTPDAVERLGETLTALVRPLAEIGHISLDVPRGITLRLGEHLVGLTLPVSWHDFVRDPEQRDTARGVVHGFAPALGAAAAIYLYNDVGELNRVDERRALTWMLDWLDGDRGPPAMTVESIEIDPIRGADHRAYWVESLAT